MFKNLILAALVAVSFGGAILTSATPAAAAFDTYMTFQSDQDISWSGSDGDESLR